MCNRAGDEITMRKPDHYLLLTWLLTTGLVVFGAVVTVDRGFMQALIETDQSRICLVIIAMYVVGLSHSFSRTLYLSRELNLAAAVERLLRSQPENEPLMFGGGGMRTAAGRQLPDSFVTRYIADLVNAKKAQTNTQASEARADILEAYASKVRGAHDFGWFYIDLMLKVGFVGTLVGFILMLGSVSQSTIIDASTMQNILKQMSWGMSTALNTTLASVVGGILLSVPYYFLDRGLDELLEQTVQMTEVRVLPRLSMPN